jgi:hypothetical protein
VFGAFSLSAKLYAGDATSYDYFGQSNNVYGNSALIGATNDDDKATDAGKIYTTNLYYSYFIIYLYMYEQFILIIY